MSAWSSLVPAYLQAVLTAPLERSTCPKQRRLSLKMRSLSSSSQDGQELCFYPEFGVSVRRKNGYNPGSVGSEFGERPVPFSEHRTLADSEFGIRTGPALVGQVRSSEKGQLLSPNSEPWQVPRKDRAETWFGRFREWFGRFGVGSRTSSFFLKKEENKGKKGKKEKK